MNNITLKQQVEGLMPDLVFPENKQYVEVIVARDQLHEFCRTLKAQPEFGFDYLISATAVDWKDHFMLVYHITSSIFNHVLVVKTRTESTEPVVDTLSDIWKSAEFHEREIFDLFGIRFNNHPDLRRLFLDDDYGFPLRKDFTDESRMIVR